MKDRPNQRGVVTYADFKGRIGSQAWYLATRTDVVRFYLFDLPLTIDAPMTSYTLIDTFDRAKLQAAGDRKTAANWANRLGLTSWTYVRI